MARGLQSRPSRSGVRSAARQIARARRRLGDRLRGPASADPREHWQRIVLNRAVVAYLQTLPPSSCSAAEISGHSHAQLPWRQYTALDYPAFDLCAPLTLAERYDVVICEQVLEHVVDPCAAAANLRGMCRAGGHVVVSTPFLVRVHELPEWGLDDYWRFTPRGLRTLLERAGLEVSDVGTWGNRRAVAANFDRWPAYRPWHSLRNERDLPLQVWAFARNRF
jgi:SAM-dependent methyltransferase